MGVPRLLSQFAVICWVGLSSLLFTTASFAESASAPALYKEALTAIRSKQPEVAIPLMKKAAKMGYPAAESAMGDYYYKGRYLKKDYQKALKWYQKSVNQDDKYGQYGLALMYYHGHGVKQNYKLSYQYNLMSAKQGLPIAIYNVGYMQYHGYGVKKNKKQALRWYKASGRKGYIDGMYNAAHMLLNGLGVKKNQTEGLMWMYQAARLKDKGALRILKKYSVRGSAPADFYLSLLYYKGKGRKEGCRT